MDEGVKSRIVNMCGSIAFHVAEARDAGVPVEDTLKVAADAFSNSPQMVKSIVELVYSTDLPPVVVAAIVVKETIDGLEDWEARNERK